MNSKSFRVILYSDFVVKPFDCDDDDDADPKRFNDSKEVAGGEKRVS